jgi:hypothetical protein
MTASTCVQTVYKATTLTESVGIIITKLFQPIYYKYGNFYILKILNIDI